MKCAAAIALGILVAPTAVSAQVFDMGGLTGTLSQDGVTRSEERRAGARGDRARRAAAANDIRIGCTRELPRFRTQYGSDHPKVMKLAGLCRNAGY